MFAAFLRASLCFFKKVRPEDFEYTHPFLMLSVMRLMKISAALVNLTSVNPGLVFMNTALTPAPTGLTGLPGQINLNHPFWLY